MTRLSDLFSATIHQGTLYSVDYPRCQHTTQDCTENRTACQFVFDTLPCDMPRKINDCCSCLTNPSTLEDIRHKERLNRMWWTTRLGNPRNILLLPKRLIHQDIGRNRRVFLQIVRCLGRRCSNRLGTMHISHGLLNWMVERHLLNKWSRR